MKIIKTKIIPEQRVSHNPEIKKKVFIEKGVIPHIMTFGEATFLPGQSVETHLHETMYEVFLITSGKAIFEVKKDKILVEEGDCITIEAGEIHRQSNPFDKKVTWLYFGVSTE